MPNNIAYSKQASRFLRRIPRNEAERILLKIRTYANDPTSLQNNVKVLHGLGLKRLRVGDWRIIFDESGNVLTIVRIGPRGGVYY
ncbi:type II toxin-antitoxin system RelE family toxin [Candidatus Phyllobacterium onerii]|jgi:mRNA interferase RelE/StbE|uniref:type II toxin-antitoxin system RelE family toxin n=1 Tax=Candidatus Phyllobacterium onerii TaxID=3020828 RepID=UPI00232B2898|nr:type II toxin-antitoxin system RelE/ParE family toxin [Phyllobacterium sp. IY22]